MLQCSKLGVSEPHHMCPGSGQPGKVSTLFLPNSERVYMVCIHLWPTYVCILECACSPSYTGHAHKGLCGQWKLRDQRPIAWARKCRQSFGRLCSAGYGDLEGFQSCRQAADHFFGCVRSGNSGSAGLGKGAIAGIVVGVLVALALAGTALVWLLPRHRRNMQVERVILLDRFRCTSCKAQELGLKTGTCGNPLRCC